MNSIGRSRYNQTFCKVARLCLNRRNTAINIIPRNRQNKHKTQHASFTPTIPSYQQGLTTQSLATVPGSWLIRGFLGLWWFMCWILDISYTCNLIAVLTVPVYPTRIETVDSLAFSDLRQVLLYWFLSRDGVFFFVLFCPLDY